MSERPLGGGAILVVDDDAGIRGLVSRILAMNGYVVIAAEDAAQALQLANQHDGPIALLLTDVSMPRIDGPTLAGRLKLERPDLRVLYMSAHSRETVLHRLGGDPVLWKPFTPEDLLDKVQESLSAVESQLEQSWQAAMADYIREIRKTFELLNFTGRPPDSQVRAIEVQRAAEQQALEKYRRARRRYLDFVRGAGALALLLTLHVWFFTARPNSRGPEDGRAFSTWATRGVALRNALVLSKRYITKVRMRTLA